MSDKPWIAFVGSKEVDRAGTLALAQALCVLKTPHGAEHSRHIVRHDRTDEEWVGSQDASMMWHWRQTKGPHGTQPAEEETPHRRRFRADIDG